MSFKTPKEIYSKLDAVWPERSTWYDYTHKRIIRFIMKHLTKHLTDTSVYVNVGSGGSSYDIAGICYHVDIVENLIRHFPYHTVASVENMPYPDSMFDAAICVGSVINYCDTVQCISELLRVIKPGGLLVLEFERSNTGELWFNSDYGETCTRQEYTYLGHQHTLWLYSEKTIKNVLRAEGCKILSLERFHRFSALANRILNDEEKAGKLSWLDPFAGPISYWTAHNMIILCRKSPL